MKKITTKADLEEFQDDLVRAIRASTAGLIEEGAKNLDEFITMLSEGAAEDLLLGNAEDRSVAEARVLIAKLRSGISVKKAVLSRFTDVLHIGGRFLGAALGLQAGGLLSAILPDEED